MTWICALSRNIIVGRSSDWMLITVSKDLANFRSEERIWDINNIWTLSLRNEEHTCTQWHNATPTPQVDTTATKSPTITDSKR